MRCRTIQWLLSDYVEGQLVEDAALMVKDHIDRCLRCRSALSLERRIVKGVRTYPLSEVPEAFAEVVLDRMAAGEAVEERIPYGSWNALKELALWIYSTFIVSLRYAGFSAEWAFISAYWRFVLNVENTGDVIYTQITSAWERLNFTLRALSYTLLRGGERQWEY